jgi:signal transduction histidine kinase
MQVSESAPRFQDSVLNLLRLESDKSASTRIALYRNLIDLMMQGRPATLGVNRPKIFQTLSRLHPDVPVKARRDVVHRIAQQRIAQPLDMVSWLSAADPDLTLSMWHQVTLIETDWLDLLPRLPMKSLSQLAVRDDLPESVRRGLVSLGAAGIGLPPSPAVLETEIASPRTETEDAALHLLPVDGNADENDHDNASAEIAESENFAAEKMPDWTQIFGKLSDTSAPEQLERMNVIARAVLGGQRIDVAASNDDHPVAEIEPPLLLDAPVADDESDVIADSVPTTLDHDDDPKELSSEAQQQIRDLLQRIAAFRKRWVEGVSTPDTARPTLDNVEALAAAADAIQADATAAQSELVTRTSDPAASDNVESADDEPLVLTTSIASNLGTAGTAQSDEASRVASQQIVEAESGRNARALSDIAASLADFDWHSDRSGRFQSAQSISLSVSHGAGLAPAMAGRSLLGLFSDDIARQVVERSLRRKSAFRDVTFHIDSGVLTGHWRLSGVPKFDTVTGLYVGYTGVAVRAGPAMLALQVPAEVAGTNSITALVETSLATTDKLATLAHETRTPLNAIMGFAQLINTQTWGEVSDQYRGKANAILEESTRLLRALDDVSDQAKFDRGAYEMHINAFHPSVVILAVREAAQEEANRRTVHLLTRIHDGLPTLWSDRDAIERALGRLVVIALAGAAAGEVVLLTAKAMPNDDVCFSVTRPHAGQGDPDKVSTVGSSFGLRLVRHLAAVLSGRVDLSERRLELIVPAAAHVAEVHRERI